MPSFRTIEAGTGAISSFSQDKKEPKYKYGTYVSGAAVRQDATEILGRLRGSVGYPPSINGRIRAQ